MARTAESICSLVKSNSHSDAQHRWRHLQRQNEEGNHVRRAAFETDVPFRTSEAPLLLSQAKKGQLHQLPHYLTNMRSSINRTIQQTSRLYSTRAANMGVTKEILKQGDGSTKASAGQEVTMEYTGWIFDGSAANKKGKQYVIYRPIDDANAQ